MPRAAAASDIFLAIAEPNRREIIDVLGRDGARAVSAIVETLGLPQPTVSKHLAILREAGIVRVTRYGRRRVYELNAKELKPVHAWVAAFEHHWDHQLDRVKARAERRAREATTRRIGPTPNKETRP